MNYKKFNGKRIEDVTILLPEISSYNNNYYKDDEGNIIYAWSNDEDYTDYTRVIINGDTVQYFETFAESFTSEGDLMEVYSEYIDEV